MAAVIMPLMATVMNGFMFGKFMPKGSRIRGSIDSVRGASIARAVKKHVIMLIIIHVGRIMRGLGISIKSAPLKPMFNDMVPKAMIKNKASMMAMLSSVIVGL